MEIFVCLLILFLIKIFEWSFALIKLMFKLTFSIFILPFKISNSKSHYSKPKQRKIYSDPIESSENHWNNNSEALDLEDIFWMEELMRDD